MEARTHKDAPAAVERHHRSEAPKEPLGATPFGAVLEAQRLVGNRATSARLAALPPRDPSQGAVQRIWSVKQFTENSTEEEEAEGKRKKVVPVDTSLAAYQALSKTDHAGCIGALATLVAECDTYLGKWFRSKARKSGVGQLRSQAAAEMTLFQAIVAADGLAYAAKMKALLKVVDDSIAMRETGLEMGGASVEAQRIIDTLIKSHDLLDQAALKGIMDEEIGRLRTIAADVTAPQIVRDVITENLQHIGEVHLQEGKPGARTAKPGETTKKYVVNHALVQGGWGSTESLGSLMHELTHVTVGETFDNAPLFLVFAKGKQAGPAGVAEIKDLAKARNKGLLAVIALADADPNLSSSQKKLVKDKCAYANQPGLQGYLGSFKEKLGGDASPEYQSLKALALDAEISGFSSTLVEYDSVINQVLLWLYDWKVKPDNPVWVKVQELATEAKAFRDAAAG